MEIISKAPEMSFLELKMLNAVIYTKGMLTIREKSTGEAAGDIRCLMTAISPSAMGSIPKNPL